MEKIDQLVKNSLVQENTTVKLKNREITNIKDLIKWVQDYKKVSEQEAKDIINSNTYLLKLAFAVA